MLSCNLFVRFNARRVVRAVGIAILSACTSSAAENQVPASVDLETSLQSTTSEFGSRATTIAQTGSAGSDALPLDSFRAEFTSTRKAIFDSEQILMSECMARSGFTYPATRYQLADLYLGIYGLERVDRAKALGYTRPEIDSEPDLVQIEMAKVPADPAARAAYTAALNGTPDSATIPVSAPVEGLPTTVLFPNGCLGEADRAIYGSPENYAAYQNLSAWAQITLQSAIERASTSGDAQAAVIEWSQCMTESGYNFDHLTQPFEADWGEPRPGDTEIRAALADIACKERTRVLGRIKAVQRGLERAAIEASPDFLATLTELRRSVLGKTTEVALDNP